MENKKDIRLASKEDLVQFCNSIGEKPFRAKQIYEWIWKKSVVVFDEMSNLSLSLREALKEHYVFNDITIHQVQKSSDRTIKVGYELHDSHLIEGVLIPTAKRMTACISSQVGCSLACTFCATGKLKMLRNLDPAEIVDQVVDLNARAHENYDKSLTNIVLMGMGEPLLNYSNVLKAIDYITTDKGLGMSAQRITLSTAGISKAIKRLADDKVRFNLALSLHAANDEKRSKIMAINESNSLASLLDALQYFHEKTGTRITLEYILFNGFNDSDQDANELAAFAKQVECKINIIEYNPVGLGDFKRASADVTDRFVRVLEKNHHQIVNVRRSRGKDIDAACGQLANKVK